VLHERLDFRICHTAVTAQADILIPDRLPLARRTRIAPRTSAIHADGEAAVRAPLMYSGTSR
jgi:hypothetical protein